MDLSSVAEAPDSRKTRSGDSSAPSGAEGDALDRAAQALAVLDASPGARDLLGAVLTTVLAAFARTPGVHDPLPETAPGSPQEALAVVGGLSTLSSGLAALEARWQTTAARRIREADAERGVARARQGAGAAQELALARRVSPAASSFSLAASQRLVTQMPRTLSALADGRCTPRQVRAICRGVSRLAPEACQQVDEQIPALLPRLDGMGEDRITALVSELVQELAPEGARFRAASAARGRGVSMSRREDGMAAVSVRMRAVDASAVMAALRAEAESRRAAGSTYGVRALEADVLVESVLGHVASLGTGAGTHRLDVGIEITDRALFDPHDMTSTARLEGYGSIPAHIIRDTLLGRPPGTFDSDPDRVLDGQADAIFRRLYTHPATGELIAMESVGRTFTCGLARMIRRRDATCRMPWCNAQVQHLDHVEEHSRGGPTSFANGQGLCARCNLLKVQGHWTVRPSDGAIILGPAATAAAPEGSSTASVRSPVPSETTGDPDPPSAPPPDAEPASAEPSLEPVEDRTVPQRLFLDRRPGTMITWQSPHGAIGQSASPRLRPPAPRPASSRPMGERSDPGPEADLHATQEPPTGGEPPF